MGRYSYLFSFLFFSAVCTSLEVSAAELDKTQAQLLKDLFADLESSFSVPTARLNNTINTNLCNWTGVKCVSSASSEVVRQLSFSNLGISSANSSALKVFFDRVCSLDTLQELDLSSNDLSSLPDSFFSNCTGLSSLKDLNLSGNGLDRQIPDFSKFVHLKVLDLSFNHLTGAIDKNLDSLTQLESLNLSTNMLNGPVPSFIGGQENGTLRELVLSMNNFTGSIPSDIFKHGNLNLLDLGQNSLTGSVPNEFNKLPKLETLLLSANHLSGGIPDSITKLANLSRFGAYQNNFSGSIPIGLTRYINVLDLSYNNLTGFLPADLLSASTLNSIDFTGNSLSGSIPVNISHNLYRMRLGGNQLSGILPTQIGELSHLSYLELDRNKFHGDIPKSLGLCKNLTLLNLASNNFENELPPELGNLSNLVVLKLQMNNISGRIPYQISNLVNLSTLNLSNNALSGEIPPQILDLRKLSNLNLQGNNLSGSIPTMISNMTYLIELQLGKNRLNGTIPEMPSSLTTALNLSHNCFSGSILSSSFSNSLELEILDLSYNNFSGLVPDSLTTLQSLTLLDLSNNNLSGTLPAFHSWVDVIISGNALLSNSFREENPNFNSSSNSKKNFHKVPVILFSLVGTFVGLLLLAGVIVFALSKRFYRVEDVGLNSDDNTIPHIINGRFITNNRIHTSNIDFSKSMEAVLNPLNVFMKTRFCTYYHVEMPSGSSYSVKKLNFSEKTIQIGSQEKFSHELEVLGRLTNSNVMVPLAYVLTVDSAYLFYEHVRMGTVFDVLHGSGDVLDWKCRYSIALGVAHGLAFLHGCTQPVLLLDLSSRSLHLKSLNEPQIGDIELYKVIDPSKSTSSLSTVAGTVGYIPPGMEVSAMYYLLLFEYPSNINLICSFCVVIPLSLSSLFLYLSFLWFSCHY
jgi:Leucine-rich repeat (LRR) protein